MLACLHLLWCAAAAATAGANEAHEAPVVLSIAESHSSGGSGLQADIKTFEAQGVFGATAIVSLKAQNTKGVQAEEQVGSSIVHGQVESVLSDMGAHAVKIGMLSTVELIHAVNATLAAHATSVHVIDPVGMVGGGGLAEGTEEMVEAVRAVLIPMATVLTPNVHAAGRLLGRAAPS